MPPPRHPFDSGPSIFAFLRERIDDLGRLPDTQVDLPDEQPAGRNQILFAAGAMDGAFGRHSGGGGSATAKANAVAKALVAVAKRPTRWNTQRLRKSIGSEGVLTIVDDVIERIVEIGPSRTDIHQVGRWLATTSASRDPVKLGIALIGVTGVEDDAAVLRVLGAHDEFTLYAATAFANGLDDPDSEIWSLATMVDGWGRIECVERLASTEDPSIRSWILRTGFRNNVMNEYLAWIAATTGGLLAALSEPEPDRDLLTAAGEIIEALVAGGPAQDMDDYTDGAEAVTAFIGHLDRHAATLGDAMAIAAVQSYLTQDADWDERSTRGWTATVRTALEERCADLLRPERWVSDVERALEASDGVEAWQASHLARVLGIDVFARQLQRIHADPIGGPWYEAWQGADTDRAEKLCRLARDLLAPESLATGPLDDLGFGPDRRAHMAFEWTLQELRKHPGVGEDLLLAGLRQPGIRSRNMALVALQHWTPAAWSAGTPQRIQSVTETDPVEQVRTLARDVLSGKPPES